jgi:tRNA A-37 threonylcarbamoyl transferase component Bud32
VSERDALTCVKDVGEGLAHLTKIGIRHNDLHPGNVVFEDGRCKIIDFGLATAGNTEPGLKDNVYFVHKLTLLAEIESASVEKISALLFDAPVKMQEALNRERDGEPG